MSNSYFIRFLKILRRTNLSRARRVLVIGSTCRGENVESYTWGAIPKDINLTDYDTLILNLVSLKLEYPEGININNLPQVNIQFSRFIFSKGSEAIIIGRPDTLVRFNNYKTDMGRLSFVDWWFPVFPSFRIVSGSTLREVTKELKFYFRYVKRWHFHLVERSFIYRKLSDYDELSVGHNQELYSDITNRSVNKIGVETETIAQNRLEDSISFKFRFLARYDAEFEGVDLSSQLPVKSSDVIWLPEPTEIDLSGAINLILERRYGKLIDRHSYSSKLANSNHSNVQERQQNVQVIETESHSISSSTLFISYARKDVAFAQKLSSDLKNHGIDIWIDELGIRSGEEWTERIAKAIDSSQAILLILSPNSVASQWVKRETIFADQKRKPIVPILYETCAFPEWFNLSFSHIQRADFSKGNYEENLSKLIGAIKSILI